MFPVSQAPDRSGRSIEEGLVNVHYVLSRIKGKRYALDRVRALRKVLSLAPITEAVVDAALAAGHRDFEDGIQYECALQGEMDLLVTRNQKHFPSGPLEVSSPAEFIAAQP